MREKDERGMREQEGRWWEKMRGRKTRGKIRRSKIGEG